MSGSDSRSQRDLLAVSLLTVVALAVALADPPGWLQAAVLLPLALLLPGYAICAALFPSDLLPRDERVVYCLVLSISAAALGGLATQLLLDLDRGVWVGLLAALTLLATMIAAARRRQAPPASSTIPGRRSLGLLSVAGILASLAIAGGAIAIAADGARDQSRRQVFTSLWAVPAGAALADGVTIGVWNHGGGTAMRLEARRHGRPIGSWRLSLRGDQRWQAPLDGSLLPGPAPLVVSLYREGSLYRRVHLDLGTEP